ncbi:oligopeptide transporter, OPT family [Nannocystis sp. ILAH1]|uniref:OPT family oligopeptide transporter n=1 Tax=unclassified Nannocystis TaxID=2627009 RepID=UPI00226F0895|nr:oligopeptide transporter, OPT family [Nannocystis sp. ILAH1]MCY1069694.1 oligopeptide transporter, OPT family [Nannocystis sp. RBIL2]
MTASTSTPPSLREFTVRAVVTGVALGVVFGAANAYLGLKVGMTVSASIPASVMTVALLRGRASLLEANLSQTIGSASTSLATGTIFTIPALFLWGMAPPFWQIALLALLGGVLGLAAMIPLRRMLIVDGHGELPYPEGRACAEVLRATTTSASGSAWIFRGMAVGAGMKLLVALLFAVPSEAGAAVPLLPKAEVALEFAPALLAVGFILGYRQAAVVVAGAVVSSLALIPLIAWIGAGLPGPLYPERELTIAQMDASQIWRQYIRYIGAGAVATAGILTVLRNMPMMAGAFVSVARGMRKETGEKATASATDRDLPGSFIAAAIAVVIAAVALVPGLIAGDLGFLARLVCALGVAVFGLLSVAVAARIVGIVGVSSQPTSGITLVTLLGTAAVFAALGWDDLGARAAVLTVGTVVAVATSKAGDISQDLKTGYLVGATPAWQQLGQLIGAACACWVVAGTVLLLSSYGFGGKELAAPQATLMKTIIEGVLSGELPWGLVATGAGISGAAMLCGVSGLAFAIGVYLPIASMLPIFLGGCVRALSERGRPAEGEARTGILAAAGVVAGEGLAGVLVAGLVVAGLVPKKAPPLLGGELGELATLALVLAICFFLYRGARATA